MKEKLINDFVDETWQKNIKEIESSDWSCFLRRTSQNTILTQFFNVQWSVTEGYVKEEFYINLEKEQLLLNYYKIRDLLHYCWSFLFFHIYITLTRTSIHNVQFISFTNHSNFISSTLKCAIKSFFF